MDASLYTHSLYITSCCIIYLYEACVAIELETIQNGPADTDGKIELDRVSLLSRSSDVLSDDHALTIETLSV